MAESPAPLLLVIAGPAGSGKSTLCDRLLKEGRGFSRVVTTTTRPPRPGEVNGVHYHFFSADEFRLRLAAGEFLEWARVHGDHEDRLYGTLRSSVINPLEAGQNLVLNIDVQGVENFRRIARENATLRAALTTVFIVVDPARMADRMRRRGQDGEPEIARRLLTAEVELREAPKFDFRIESRSRDEDFAALLAIIWQVRPSPKVAD
ncbi:MAG: guanylate kinase [Opitutaceae bacterium]